MKFKAKLKVAYLWKKDWAIEWKKKKVNGASDQASKRTLIFNGSTSNQYIFWLSTLWHH